MKTTIRKFWVIAKTFVPFLLKNSGCLVINLVVIGVSSIVLALFVFVLPAPLFRWLASFFLYFWHVWLAAALSSLLIATALHMYRRMGGTLPSSFGHSLVAFFNSLDPNPRPHPVLDGVLLFGIGASFVLLGIWILTPKCLNPNELKVSFALEDPAVARTHFSAGETILLPPVGAEVGAVITLSNLVDPQFQPECIWDMQGDASLSPLQACSVALRPGLDSNPDTVIMYLAKARCTRHGPYTFFIGPP